MKGRECVCPYCNHKQKSKSNLKRITCSSCGRKYYVNDHERNEKLQDKTIKKKKTLTKVSLN